VNLQSQYDLARPEKLFGAKIRAEVEAAALGRTTLSFGLFEITLDGEKIANPVKDSASFGSASNLSAHDINKR
jgi:hypothetical protein